MILGIINYIQIRLITIKLKGKFLWLFPWKLFSSKVTVAGSCLVNRLLQSKLSVKERTQY